ncbi:DUF3182 family protein [Candidimonas sp. SYP-B2681]|nr:DUF3182 family protein [Candidimonas sp. SYP-B2681]
MSSGVVVIYPAREHEPEHEKKVHHELAKRIAHMLGMEFAGEYDAAKRYTGRVYFLPSDTLIGIALAQSLGIKNENDLFGGVAPHPFIPTKAISHPLLDSASVAPQGWSHEFGKLVQDSVLRGFTSFSLEDARKAGKQLLLYGPLRIKPVLATAGRGQVLVSNLDGLATALEDIDTTRLADCGVVLEEHLDDVKTYSVGQVRVAGMIASYVGTQRLTPDNRGEMVYGGSELIVALGDFDTLQKLDLAPDYQTSITKAKAFDAAASKCFTGFFASRRNYDVASGLDSKGNQRCGVLEQSWRTGGASAAEIAALETFHTRTDVRVVRASTMEIFGDRVQPPAGANEVFYGQDPDLGLIRKYVMVEPYGN